MSNSLYDQYRDVCKSIPHEELEPIGVPLMIGATIIPRGVAIPDSLRKLVRDNGECHHDLRKAIIDVTIERMNG